MVSSQESPIKVDDWGNDYTKCGIKRGLLDAYKRLMWNGDEGGVWDIIRHQKWRKNDVGTKSGCCSSPQQLELLGYSSFWLKAAFFTNTKVARVADGCPLQYQHEL